MIEREDIFGLYITLKPIETISHNKSPYKHFDSEKNNDLFNTEYDKNIVYFNSVVNPDHENESFDTKYELKTDEGILIDNGILHGFKES